MNRKSQQRGSTGETVVLKFGGEIAGDRPLLDVVFAEIARCVERGVRMTVVHGGGKQGTDLSRRLGLETHMVAGRRVTDAPTLEVLKMAFAGTINTDVLAACRAAGVRAVGISGIDGGLVRVARRPPRLVVDPVTGERRTVDYGFVGDIVSVDATVATDLMDAGFVPVVAPLAADDDGVVYNVNADDIAAAIATRLGARRLIIASNISGVRDAAGDVIPHVDELAARDLIRRGVVTGGMIPKLEAALAAVAAGVECVRIVDGTSRGSLEREILQGAESGTTVAAPSHAAVM
ncbi:MAG TPA: acetylglutamate kinase [Blastocatellia bacterium]|nr:acetylglutamate kinase [Blastocatellia bacterium]